jgi:hypothetical protein
MLLVGHFGYPQRPDSGHGKAIGARRTVYWTHGTSGDKKVLFLFRVSVGIARDIFCREAQSSFRESTKHGRAQVLTRW